MENKNIRILIADDHNIVRAGIISMLESVNGYFIVGEAENGQELVTKYFEVKPDIVLSDISMPQLSGIEALKKIIKRDKTAKVLFLSMFGGDDYVYEIVAAGGKGLVQKNIVKGELLFAIESVYAGNSYFGKEYNNEKVDKLFDLINHQVQTIDTEEIRLTDREIEIIKYVYRGLKSREIAEQLCVSKRTIDQQRNELLRKLNINSTAELIRIAIIKEII